MTRVDAAILDELVEELLELQSIAHGVAAVEQQFGPHDMIDDVWRRHRRLCDQLLEQLRQLLSADWHLERVH